MWPGSFSSHLEHINRPRQASLRCPYFWHLKHFRGAGTYISIANIHLLGCLGLVKCQDISVGLDSFFFFCRGSSNVCNFLFSQGCWHLFCCSQNKLLLRTFLKSVMNLPKKLLMANQEKLDIEISAEKPLVLTKYPLKTMLIRLCNAVCKQNVVKKWMCSITSLTKVSKWAVNTTLTEILVLTSTSAKECYPRIHRLSLFSLPVSLLFSLALPLPLANQRR